MRGRRDLLHLWSCGTPFLVVRGLGHQLFDFRDIEHSRFAEERENVVSASMPPLIHSSPSPPPKEEGKEKERAMTYVALKKLLTASIRGGNVSSFSLLTSLEDKSFYQSKWAFLSLSRTEIEKKSSILCPNSTKNFNKCHRLSIRKKKHFHSVLRLLFPRTCGSK